MGPYRPGYSESLVLRREHLVFVGANQDGRGLAFIVGAFGMLIGSIDEAVVKYERHRLNI